MIYAFINILTQSNRKGKESLVPHVPSSSCDLDWAVNYGIH